MLVLNLISNPLFSQKYNSEKPNKNYKLYSDHELVDIPKDNLSFSDKKAKNIILMIGDGMGTGQITAGLAANKGKLNMMLFPVGGLVKTNSANDLVTDSAAGGTSMATGQKTNNGMISIDPDGKPLTTILEVAEKNGKSTGLVVTSKVVDATPAAFYAHVDSRYLEQRIASEFMKIDIEFLVGGGNTYFTERLDQRNLATALETKGYDVVDNIADLGQSQSDRIVGLIYHQDPPSIIMGRGEMLVLSTLKAIEVLSKNESGFFLVIEGSQIDWGSHGSNPLYVAEEVMDFDRAIGIALQFAAKDQETLVIVTADHETGGMTVAGGSYEKGEFDGIFNMKEHSANVVPIFAYGPSAYKFGGFYENTDIHKKMMEIFQLSQGVSEFSGVGE